MNYIVSFLLNTFIFILYVERREAFFLNVKFFKYILQFPLLCYEGTESGLDMFTTEFKEVFHLVPSLFNFLYSNYGSCTFYWFLQRQISQSVELENSLSQLIFFFG